MNRSDKIGILYNQLNYLYQKDSFWYKKNRKFTEKEVKEFTDDIWKEIRELESENGLQNNTR